MLWFSSDHHFGHGKISVYCGRPFFGKELDDFLISNWNSKVKKDDIVYHLGDFGFGSRYFLGGLRDRLNGRIHLILGNHDKAIKGDFVQRFESVSHYKEVKVQHPPIWLILFHYPIQNWNKRHFGSIHLHGHSHGKSEQVKNRIDVGVDTQNYTPVSLDEILQKVSLL
jgi:calcineurin-like phosphoesterase family protein